MLKQKYDKAKKNYKVYKGRLDKLEANFLRNYGISRNAVERHGGIEGALKARGEGESLEGTNFQKTRARLKKQVKAAKIGFRKARK